MDQNLVILIGLTILIILAVALVLIGVLIYYQLRQMQKQGQGVSRKKEHPQIASSAEKIVPPQAQRNDNRASARMKIQEISPVKDRLHEERRPIVGNLTLTSSNMEGDLVLTNEFLKGLELMSGDSACIFITGKAGTGKSRLMQHFHKNTEKNIVLLAPTGMAAMRVNGQTIHSFFGFPPKLLSDEDIKPSNKREMYRALDTIIIDEISMVRADMLDAIDKFLRLNGKTSKVPFGGIQMIFFGDLYQLPPVIGDEDEGKYLATNYLGSFFFDAHVMQDLPLEKLELSKVFRQKDLGFVNALNAVRVEQADQSILDYINQRHEPILIKDRRNLTSLVTTNKAADQINTQELAKINAPVFTYIATLEGVFTKSEYKKRMPADQELYLKVGALVIFTKNETNKRWHNGSIGRIIELGKDYIKAEVRQENGSFVYEVPRETWEIIRYKFDFDTFKIKSEVIGKFTQYPLRLGWAITIHKSQGASMDRVHIDMGQGAFAAGQLYVALSRSRSLEGMTLERPILFADIKTDSSVKRFMQSAFPEHEASVLSNQVEKKVHASSQSKGARFPDEVLKYGSESGPREWFYSEDSKMIIPLHGKRNEGIDVRQYRGDCNIYIGGEYRWKSTIRDDLSAQSLWHAVKEQSNVSIEPLDKYIPVAIRSVARK